MSSPRWPAAGLPLCCVLLLLGCDGEAPGTDGGPAPNDAALADAGGVDASASDAGPRDAGSDDGGGVDAGPPEPPLFIVHSAVQTTDARLNYFTPVTSLTDAVTLDYDASIEVPGRARLYASPGLGFFAIGDSEDVSLTRYDVDAEGALTEGDRLSFAALGVTTLGAQAVHFGSPTVAYYKDASQAQIIVWDPTAMEIVGTIELPASLIREGWTLSFGDWTGRGDDAFFTVTWYSRTYDRVGVGTGLVHIDTRTNEVTVTEDARCRAAINATEIDGAIYYFSGVINGFGHAVAPGDAGQQDCSLRIAAGSVTFDDGYLGTIAPALPSDRVGTVITSTGTDLWAQVADLSITPSAPGTTYSEWYASGWTWWRVPLDASAATQITTEPGAYSGFNVTYGASFLLAESEPDYSSTTFIDLATGAAVPGLTFPGFALDVARVR